MALSFYLSYKARINNDLNDTNKVKEHTLFYLNLPNFLNNYIICKSMIYFHSIVQLFKLLTISEENIIYLTLNIKTVEKYSLKEN